MLLHVAFSFCMDEVGKNCKGERKKNGMEMKAVQVHSYRHWLGSNFRQPKRIRLHKLRSNIPLG